MNPALRRLRTAGLHRVRRLAGAARSLRPTLRTSLWEVRVRRPPEVSAYRHSGKGSVVVPPGRITNPDRLTLGSNVLLHEGVSILIGERSAGVRIGDGTVLSRYAHIASEHRVEIGRHVSSSDHIAIIDTWASTDHTREPPLRDAAVVVEDGAYLGFGSILCPGVTVGAGAFVGEGAVVTSDVPPHTVVYGNPATAVRRWADGAWTGPRFP